MQIQTDRRAWPLATSVVAAGITTFSAAGLAVQRIRRPPQVTRSWAVVCLTSLVVTLSIAAYAVVRTDAAFCAALSFPTNGKLAAEALVLRNELFVVGAAAPVILAVLLLPVSIVQAYRDRGRTEQRPLPCLAVDATSLAATPLAIGVMSHVKGFGSSEATMAPLYIGLAGTLVVIGVVAALGYARVLKSTWSRTARVVLTIAAMAVGGFATVFALRARAERNLPIATDWARVDPSEATFSDHRGSDPVPPGPVLVIEHGGARIDGHSIDLKSPAASLAAWRQFFADSDHDEVVVYCGKEASTADVRNALLELHRLGIDSVTFGFSRIDQERRPYLGPIRRHRWTGMRVELAISIPPTGTCHEWLANLR